MKFGPSGAEFLCRFNFVSTGDEVLNFSPVGNNFGPVGQNFTSLNIGPTGAEVMR